MDNHDEQFADPPLPHDNAPFDDWVSVEEAVLICTERGLSRTPKTVRKWASRSQGKDDGQAEILVRRQDTANGNFRWRIERISLERKVDQELELLQSAPSQQANENEPDHTRAHMLAPVRTGSDKQNNATFDENPDKPERTGLDQSAQATPDKVFYKNQLEQKDEQIGQLNKQLERRDEQIMAMLERDRETNILIQGLQQSLTTVIDVLPSARQSEGEQPAPRYTQQRHHDITPPVDTRSDIENYGV